MYGKFLVEGDKMVNELIKSKFEIEVIYHVWDHKPSFPGRNIETAVVSDIELRKISIQENPDKCVAVALIPKADEIESISELPNGLYIACDDISDPGNAGAILRVADWFGIDRVFLSENSVDVYNPKAVAASKGSIFRVRCSYLSIESLLSSNPHISAYGTFKNGESIYTAALTTSAFIIVGNEANGISAEIEKLTDHKISIPAFGRAESLNAAVATGIVVSEFKRRALL